MIERTWNSKEEMKGYLPEKPEDFKIYKGKLPDQYKGCNPTTYTEPNIKFSPCLGFYVHK